MSDACQKNHQIIQMYLGVIISIVSTESILYFCLCNTFVNWTTKMFSDLFFICSLYSLYCGIDRTHLISQAELAGCSLIVRPFCAHGIHALPSLRLSRGLWKPSAATFSLSPKSFNYHQQWSKGGGAPQTGAVGLLVSYSARITLHVLPHDKLTDMPGLWVAQRALS